MFISIEETPNPNSLKFLPEKPLFENSNSGFQFNSKEEVNNSDFSSSLFDIEGVKSVFLCKTFISITKENDIIWDNIKTEVMLLLTNHIKSKKPIIEFDEEVQTNSENISSENNEIILEIKELLETKIRPSVAEDGGDIIFHEFKDGIVYLEMQGACSGCPQSTITLKNGIENMLKYYIPEIESVESIN